MIYYSLIKNNEYLISNTPKGLDTSDFYKVNLKKIKPKNIKRIRDKNVYVKYEMSPNVEIELIFIDEMWVTGSPVKLSLFINSIESFFSELEVNLMEKVNYGISGFVHDIIKINGDQKAILSRLLSSLEDRHYSHSEMISHLVYNISSQPENVAIEILKLQKHVLLADSSIAGQRLIAGQIKGSLKQRRIRAFLLHIYHTFVDDFREKNINFTLDVPEELERKIETETFRLAFHNFFQNSLKYSKPDSSITLQYNNESDSISVFMDSIKIHKSELSGDDCIFNDGVFGREAPGVLRGSGLGLKKIINALSYSGVEFKIFPGNEDVSVGDVLFTKDNQFWFIFSK